MWQFRWGERKRYGGRSGGLDELRYILTSLASLCLRTESPRTSSEGMLIDDVLLDGDEGNDREMLRYFSRLWRKCARFNREPQSFGEKCQVESSEYKEGLWQRATTWRQLVYYYSSFRVDPVMSGERGTFCLSMSPAVCSRIVCLGLLRIYIDCICEHVRVTVFSGWRAFNLSRWLTRWRVASTVSGATARVMICTWQ